MMTFLLLATLVLGGLVSGPLWIEWSRRRTLEDVERWNKRRP